MNLDIVSELSGLYDLGRTIPTLTIFFIAASGILLLCFGIGLILMTRRYVGLRFFPVLYGATAYLLFYFMIGSFISGLISMSVPADAGTGIIVFTRFLVLIITSALIVGGRFFAMWFIRKYYPEYCDAYGIGVGVSLTEAIITGITIFLNYSLCRTLNTSGLESLVNSFDSVDEAVTQLEAVLVFYDNPSYTYIFSGVESIMFMIFNTMISVMFYGVFHGELGKVHLLSIIGLQTLIYLPGNLYSSGFLFNRITCFMTEVLIFAACTLLFLRIHNTCFKDITPPAGSAGAKRKKNVNGSAGSKMPDFNKNINK